MQQKMGLIDSHTDLPKIVTGPTIVLAHDSLYRETLCNQLHTIGITNIQALENIEQLEAALADENIAMIICNIEPWSEKLLTVLKHIRTSSNKSCPFLTLTSGTDRLLIEKFIQAKVSDIILTPFTADILKSRILRLITAKDPVHPHYGRFDVNRLHRFSDSDLVASNQDSPTILVVDDVPDNLMLITSVFRKEFHLKLVKDGDKAIRICQSDSPPDLVLLDIMMPNLNGFDVARILREHPHSEHIPIVFMTALDDSYSRKRAMKLGAVDFITKPIDIEMLRFRIANLMRLVDARRNLQKEFDQMLELNTLKESLEFNIRYEIKEPLLNAAHQLQELMTDPTLNMTQKTHLSIAKKSVVDALDLTRLASELYKIETGIFVMKAEKVRLFDIFNRLAIQFQNVYSWKNISIKLNKPQNYLYDELFISGNEFLCYSSFQILLRLACEHAESNTTVNIICQRTPESITLTINSKTLLKNSMTSALFDKHVLSHNQDNTTKNGYHGKAILEAHGATMAFALDEENHLLSIVIVFPQKEDLTQYS
ncbi:response regulator [Aeromonas sp. MdU4]|uniref:response regulator n=1 Tax=Aeromonas sp. MdU4 TaxID=3342819 RepID=UPI0035B7F143